MRESFLERYRVDEEIGTGRFGSINRCFNTETGELLACKTIEKANLRDSLDMESLHNETRILKHLADHGGIVELHDVHEDEERMYLVMELCSGGDLFDKIAQRKRLSEKEAAGVLRSVMEAVDFCHRKGVAHRDLKPDNILFSDDQSSAPLSTGIKIADFGQASFFSHGGGKMSGIVGTPYYVAPEVVEGREYNEKVDVWSAGVILYIMLSSFPPFNGDTPQQIFESVLRGRLRFPTDPWLTISHPAKDLIRRMLSRDVDRRFSVDQVLGSRWIMKKCV